MVNRPLLSVRAVRFTPPCTDVAVMLAFSMGALSGPVIWPRMTSRPCADARLVIANRAMIATTTIEGMRRDTGVREEGIAAYRYRRPVGHPGRTKGCLPLYTAGQG